MSSLKREIASLSLLATTAVLVTASALILTKSHKPEPLEVEVVVSYPEPPEVYAPDAPYANFILSLPEVEYPIPPEDAFQITCLAINTYHEARAETTWQSRIATSFVVKNRANLPQFKNDLCAVVFTPWAFSWTMDPKDHYPKDLTSWKDAVKLSVIAYYDLMESPVGLADHYYNDKLASPAWGGKLTAVKKLGNHKFGVLNQ